MNRTMTVSQLSSYIKGVFDDEELLHDVTLSGEVAEISYSDRHTFLVLAEGDYSVRCVHFSSRDNIEKGARIALRGSVRFYDKRGSVTFNYREYYLCGDGAKNAKLLAVKQRLRDSGYFENRPQLPKYIVNVVVVTSPDGAAIRDFERVVHDKCPFVKIRVYPVKVQGVGAAAQITRAVEKLQSYSTDAIVLCRGGGSDEDLDCFNDEALAVAVAESRIPVISAVGHEVDYTLCDFCAGARAGTPSIAGEIVASRARALTNDISGLLYSGRAALAQKCEARRRRLEKLGAGIAHVMSERIADRIHAVGFTAQRGYYAVEKKFALDVSRLSASTRRLSCAADRLIGAKRERLDRLTELLSALDPHRIINTGYAAVMLDGRRVFGVKQLGKSDTVRLVFADGTATATIENIKYDK